MDFKCDELILGKKDADSRALTMIVEAGRNWILRAKTGWEGRMGWWVGWVEWPTGSVFFALNIDTPNRMDDLFKREAIVRAILRSIEALPPNPAVNSDAAR